MNPDYSKSTAGITLDEELVKKYHAKTVEYALALKATYGDKYTDDFYLDYAHRNNVIAMYGATSANYMKIGCPIQDSEWAGYSYEEIIAMENNGYKIPEEVLLWAHSCQESDVTAYQVVSGEAMLDDGTSTEEINGDFSLENLQKKAKQYITKSQKAQKAAEADMQEYNELAQKAEKIKQEKEDTYKDSMKEVSKLTNEFKQLDNKFKNKTLTPSEQQRYNELSKKLGGSNSILKEIQIETEDLDELLSGMDALNVEIDNNLVLAGETIKAGEDLAKFDSKTHELQQKHNFFGIVFNDSGLLDNILYGEKGATIQRIAIDTGRDLSEYSSDSLADLSTEGNVQLVDFATNYVEEAKKTGVAETENLNQSSENKEDTLSDISDNENESQTTEDSNVNNTAENASTSATSQSVKARSNTSKRRTVSKTRSNTSSQSTNQNNDSEVKVGNNPNYFVLSGTTLPVLTALATATNLASIADLMIRNGKVEDIQKQLTKDWAKTEKDIQKVQKQTAMVEQKHEEYIKRAENALGQLEGVQAQKEQEMLAAMEESMKSQNQTAKSNNVNVSGAESTEKNGNTQQQVSQAQQEEATPAVTMSPAQAQENALLEQLDYLSAADAKLANQIQKPIAQQKAAVVKNQKTAKVLDVNNDQLIDRTKNNRKVSQATMSSGIATTASGVINMFLSNQMITLGVKLMMSYWTMPLGVALVAKGVLGKILATEQLVTGPIAIATATGGLVASSEVSEDSKDYNKSVANARKLANQNNKLLRDSTNVMNTLGSTIEVPDLSDQQQFQTAKQPMNNGPEVAPNLGKSRTAEVNFTSTKDITNPARTIGNMIADSVLISDPNIKNKKQENVQNSEPQENQNNIANGNAVTAQNSTVSNNKVTTTPYVAKGSATSTQATTVSSVTNTSTANTQTVNSSVAKVAAVSKQETSTPSIVQPAVVSNSDNSTSETSQIAIEDNNKKEDETSTKAESAPKISSAIPSISTASVSNDTAFSTGSTTETEKVEENVKDETTKNTDNSAKAGKENLVVQINNLETKNNGAEKSEKINEILVNNVQKAQMLQQQLAALNNGVQNVAPDSVSDEINPVQGEMDAVSVQIANIINNAQAKMTGSSQETEEDTQDIEAEEKHMAAKGQSEYDVIEAEQPLTKEDENILAATVSSNAATKTTASTNTDDKIERKLARFNQDSIIESKKKKKKVMAVSASSNKKS